MAESGQLNDQFLRVGFAGFLLAAYAAAPVGPTQTTLPLETPALTAESEPMPTEVTLISELVVIQVYEDPHFDYAFDYPWIGG